MSAIEHKSMDGREPQSKSAYARQLDAIAWAMLLIWAGVAILTNLGWGWALLGTSGIVLAVQAALRQRGEPVDGFAVVMGLVLLIGGAWLVFGLTWPLAPVLLILLGIGLLWNAVFGTRSYQE